MPHDPQTQTGLHRVPQDKARALTVDADHHIGVHEQLVEVAEDAGAITLTLPSVDEAGGRHYSIAVPTAGTSDVTITGPGLADELELAADGDAVLLYSDSRRWYVVADMIASE